MTIAFGGTQEVVEGSDMVILKWEITWKFWVKLKICLILLVLGGLGPWFI